MTAFFDLINTNIPWKEMLAFFIRIVVAGVCGAAVGVERSRRFKEAGIRTHIVVACTAAVLMIVSKYGFADLTDAAGTVFAGTRGADPARIAAQIVSGVGFLGAGVIFKNGSSIKGLTTAAGIWATAAIGMSIGSGLYYIGLFATLIIVLVQIIMHIFTVGNDSFTTNELLINVENSAEFQAVIKQQLKEWKAQTVETKIVIHEDDTDYRIIVKLPKDISFDEILDFINENEAVQSFECHSVS